ncbi:homoserine kinase [Microlunatus soli]|uniref:Homoserine kinase n=1 Tax=Microlunatus soli TaxID=630515 RepID=A0A1H1ZUD9_9ACTN|nr:homoserine kinase [Microlunatus soli]SDT36876.1 homoserine kinase [Microlunatus soli]
MSTIPIGRRVEVEVPATSANLGPGFDSLGVALDLNNSCSFESVQRPGVSVEVVGEGAGRLPTDERNLIVRSLDLGLKRLGQQVVGLRLRAVNRIPASRGMGSSSAAIVTGLIAAHALARPDEEFDPAEWLGLADEIEGHPDNVAAALYGGLVVAYRPLTPGGLDLGAGAAAGVVGVHPDVRLLALVPSTPLGTELARSVLPEAVPHRVAAANAGRAALLVHALSQAPELLFEATADWLHQNHRADVMPQSAVTLRALRQHGIPAVISGAGPTVLVIGTPDQIEEAETVPTEGFVPVRSGVGVGARVVAAGTAPTGA